MEGVKGVKLSDTFKTVSLSLKESKLDTEPNYFHFIGCVKTAKRIGEPESLHVFQLYHQTTKGISSHYEMFLTWRELLLVQTDFGNYNWHF